MTDAPEPAWLRGKHWHPSTGWTNHSAAACAQTVKDSEHLAGLRRVLAAVRKQRART